MGIPEQNINGCPQEALLKSKRWKNEDEKMKDGKTQNCATD
ncbi:MAG: hypothetical protein ACW97A_04955 [Candidatus Thorarchaeota archaeon]